MSGKNSVGLIYIFFFLIFKSMKNKGKCWLYTLLLIGMVIVLAFGCKKDSNEGSAIGNTTAVFNPNLTYGTMTDQDDNVCKTIQIGTQVWMAENLKVTKYRNGELIGTTDPATLSIANEMSPKYQWPCLNDESNVATYGRLYTWDAVNDSRNLAPEGWHVARYDEWITLRDMLGGESIAGGKLKETGTTHWSSPNTGATNESGFTALPGGLRDPGGFFYTTNQPGNWWTSTESVSPKVWHAYTDGVAGYLLLLGSNKSVGYAVRCVRD
jgi:uncharacterized protein (TIGR02145 family)